VAKPPGLRLLRSIVRAGNAHQRALTKLFTTSAPTYGKPRKAPSGNNDHKAGHDTRRENTFPIARQPSCSTVWQIASFGQNHLARLWLLLNRMPPTAASRLTIKPVARGRRRNTQEIRDYRVDRKLLLRVVRIAGLGHAWS